MINRQVTRARPVNAAVLVLGLLAGNMLGSSTTAEAATSAVPPAPNDGITVELRPFVEIPNTRAGDPPRINAMATDGDRLFVVEERDGIVYEILDRKTQPRAVVFFDVGAAITQATGRQLDQSNAFHSGLRSVAFHPDFAENGLLYVAAMETRPADPGSHRYLSDVPNPVGADSVLIEFQAPGETVDPTSYREVFRVGMPVYDHTIRQIAFDPTASAEDPDRHLLYIAHGDGSEASATAGGGQRDDALGKILRLDPRVQQAAPYAVPADNPFVGNPAMLDEVYSLGHRNPHTLAFVPLAAADTMLISAEPGRDNVEELNIISSGGDYGWSNREGTFVHNQAGGGLINGVGPLPANEADFGYTYPAAQYGHEGVVGETVTGESIAGGYGITNGSALDGLYFLADFPSSGNLFHVPVDELAATVRRLTPGQAPSALTQATLHESRISFDHDNNGTTPPIDVDNLRDVFAMAPTYRPSRADVRFGQGPGGELYITSKRNNLVYLVTNSVATAPPTPDDPTSPPLQRGLIRDAASLDEILAATDYEPADAELLRLYRSFFERDPDVAGAKYWLAQARQDASFDDIAWAFAASSEFADTYGLLDDVAFVLQVYRNVLGREPDQAGATYWLDLVRSGTLAPHGVVRWIAASDEFTARYPYVPL